MNKSEIRTEMSKEKLTVESIGKLITYDMCKYKSGEEILKNLLKQIRDEIIEKRVESQSYYTSKAMQDINDVFNKYLNEKGGK